MGIACLVACQPAATPTVVPTTPPTPTATPQPTRPQPLPTAPRGIVSQPRTVRVRVSFDTYETEETVQSELSQLPGVLSLVVTQLEVTATYDPARVTRDEILRVLRSNPEVKLRSEPVEE
jgi:hypothetical protein